MVVGWLRRPLRRLELLLLWVAFLEEVSRFRGFLWMEMRSECLLLLEELWLLLCLLLRLWRSLRSFLSFSKIELIVGLRLLILDNNYLKKKISNVFVCMCIV